MHGSYSPQKTALLLVALLIAAGTLGFSIFEQWDILDSFYATVVTVGTVGYGDFHPVSDAGKLFAAGLIIAGVGTAAYAFSVISRSIIEGELAFKRGQKRMEQKLSRLSGHTIICGYGRLGRIVTESLLHSGAPLVVVDSNAQLGAQAGSDGAIFVVGNAHEDEVLLHAGVDRAQHLLALVASESDNVYIVLTARHLNPRLNIVARSDDPSAEQKLMRAGANAVVAPYRLTGQRLVDRLLRPNVSKFLDVAGSSGSEHLAFEEIRIPEHSPITGKTIEESGLRMKTGVFVAAIIDANGTTTFNPDAKTVISSGSTLIVLGRPSILNNVANIVSPA